MVVWLWCVVVSGVRGVRRVSGVSGVSGVVVVFEILLAVVCLILIFTLVGVIVLCVFRSCFSIHDSVAGEAVRQCDWCAQRVPTSSSLRCKSLWVYCCALEVAMIGVTKEWDDWPHARVSCLGQRVPNCWEQPVIVEMASPAQTI